MNGKRAGTGIMMAGAIVILVGLGIVLVKTFEVPRYWVPLLVGIALFVMGAIRWAASRERQ